MANDTRIATAKHERLQVRAEILLRISDLQERTNNPGYMSNVARMIIDAELDDIVVCTHADEISKRGQCVAPPKSR